MSTRFICVFVLAAAILSAQGTITSLTPSGTAAGGSGFTLTVNGSGFASTNLVQWDSTNLATTFGSSTQLTATVGASLITTTGTHNIRVRLAPLSLNFSNTVTFNVNNPIPTLTSLTPSVTIVGGPSLTLTVGGTNYNSSSVVRFAGAPLATTFVSATQLTATLDAASITTTGTRAVTVHNPAPGGGTSVSANFLVNNPIPTFSSMTPSAGHAGLSSTVTVTGTGFNSSTQVRVAGVAQTTTLISATQVSAPVTPSFSAGGTSITIDVLNPLPGGGTSSTSGSFGVVNPLPVLTSISPGTVLTGSPATTITFNGSGFVTTSFVVLDGSTLATTFVSGTQLTAIVPGSTFATTTNHLVNVTSPPPVGGNSAPIVLLVQNPVPVISAFAPGSTPVGTGPINVSVQGTGFMPNSVVRLGGTNLATTYFGPALLNAVVPASMTTAVASLAESVFTPSPGGGTATFGTFQVVNPVPTLASLSPNGSVAGAIPFTLTATGTGYTPDTTILVDGSPLTTTLISATQVSTTIPSSLTTIGGVHTVTVSNAAPGGGASSGVSWTVGNPPPTFASSAPGTAAAGVPTVIGVLGVNFNPSTVVRANGVALPTNFVSFTQLSATITPSAADIGSALTIEVFTPAPVGGVAGSGSLSIVNPAPVINVMSASVILGGGPDIVLNVGGTGFVPATAFHASGLPLATTYQSPILMQILVPAALQREIRELTVTATNAAPGGGSSSTPLVINGPAVAGTNPAVVPILTAGSPAVPLTVQGSGFTAGDVILVNGSPRATTFVNPGALTCNIDGSLSATLHPGGFAITVVRLGAADLVTSNAVGVTVGIAGAPDNAGTVTFAPAFPAPGQSFDLRVETPSLSGPVTLVADLASPPPFVLNLAPGFDLVIGPALGVPLILADGLGLFGPATPASLAPDSLASLGVAPRGLFEMPGITAPAVPLGITFSIVAIYFDPSSPIGVNVTHINGPHSL